MNDYKKGDKSVFYTGDYYFGDNTTFAGTTGNDKMWIAGRFSTISASSGDDIVSLVSSSNNSLVYLGTGNDFLGTNFTTNHTIYGGKGNDTIRFVVSRSYANGEADDDNSVTCDGGSGNDRFWFIESTSKVSLAGGSGQDTYHFDPYYLFGPYHNDVIIKDISDDDIIRYDFEGTNGNELSYSKDSNGNIVLKDEDNGFFTITLQGVTDISQVANVTYQGMDATRTLGDIFSISGGEGDDTSEGEDTTEGGEGEDTDEGGNDEQFSFNDDETTVELFEDYEDVFDASDYEELKTIDGSAVTSGIEIHGNELKNSIIGGSGDDTLYGGEGNDTLKGGNGKDVFVYSDGDGNDVITDYTAGKDKIKIESGSIKKASLSGSNVIFTVGSGKITVKNAKNKKITIVDEDDNSFTTLISGKDTISNSTKVTLSNTDSSIFTAASKIVTIDASKRSKAIKITGNTKANKIYGGKAKDTLYGGGGNDLLKGNAGNDKLFGDAGNDTLYGGAGVDTLSGGAGNDKLYGDAGNDSLAGGAGADTLSGGTGNDTLTGNAGKDVFLFDGKGKDVITDYTAGQDKIVLTNEDENISVASIKGSDVIFTIGEGTLTVKKGKGKKITIIDANGDETTEKYTKTTYFDNDDDEDDDDYNDDDEMDYMERPWFAKDDNFVTDDVSTLLDSTTKNISSIEQSYNSTSLMNSLTTNMVQSDYDFTTVSFAASKNK